MIEVLAAAVVACLVSLATLAAIRLHRRRMALLRYHRLRFFDVAQRVLAEDAIDDARLLKLRRMAADIDSKKTFLILGVALADTLRELGAGREAELRAGRAPQHWPDLLFHYYLAISYLHGARGVWLRATLARVLEPGAQSRNTDLIEQRVHQGRLSPA
jgi:hypothetical protein